MSDCIDDRIEGNFVFLAVRATDGSGRRAGVDLPMDPDELARFEGEQGLMAPSDYRIDGYSKDGIVGRMGFAPFRDDSPLEDVNLLCRAVDAASRSDPHAADKVAAWTGNGVLDRFLEDESLFGEFLRTPVSEGGVESLVVGPPHIVVEVGA